MTIFPCQSTFCLPLSGEKASCLQSIALYANEVTDNVFHWLTLHCAYGRGIEVADVCVYTTEVTLWPQTFWSVQIIYVNNRSLLCMTVAAHQSLPLSGRPVFRQ